MKAYKGMDKNMRCRDFQYEPGKTYETDKADACRCGFHACEVPLEVFSYYEPANSRYFEVEQDGELSKCGKDSKVASTKLTVGAEIGILGLVKAHIDYVRAHATMEHTDSERATAGNRGAATAGNRGAATAGEYGAATAGEYGAATAGYAGAATAGYAGAATAGECGAATAGNRGAATAGNRGAATAGEYGAATAGEYGAATAGECGAATARGFASVGKDGCALVRGNNVKAKGGLGAILVICEENDENFGVKCWKAAVVDGEKIKADTWYCLEDGEFAEVDEDA